MQKETKLLVKDRLKNLHFGLLAFLALNLPMWLWLDLGLIAPGVFFIKMLTYASGLALFFLTFRNRGWLFYYTSLYLLSPVAVFLGYLMDGIFGAILASVFFLLWGAPETILTADNLAIRKQYAGFLGACCTYEVYENRYGLLEHKAAEFQSEFLPAEISGINRISFDQAQISFKAGADLSDTIRVQLH